MSLSTIQRMRVHSAATGIPTRHHGYPAAIDARETLEAQKVHGHRDEFLVTQSGRFKGILAQSD